MKAIAMTAGLTLSLALACSGAEAPDEEAHLVESTASCAVDAWLREAAQTASTPGGVPDGLQLEMDAMVTVTQIQGTHALLGHATWMDPDPGEITFAEPAWIPTSALQMAVTIDQDPRSAPLLDGPDGSEVHAWGVDDVLGTDGEAHLEIHGCQDGWVEVSRGGHRGWLAKANQCSNPMTSCNILGE